jgi:putative two-component system response regulator
MNHAHRILAVDDNPDNLMILEELLAAEFDFRAVLSGEEALNQAAAFSPDLILLDLVMPGLDGFETCRALSGIAELRETKVIILSARADVNDRLAAYRVGAVDYISKPFNDEEVLTKVRTWMRMVQHREINKIWCDLEEARDGLGRTLTSLVEMRDTETGEHLFRMRWYSQLLAEQLSVAGPYQSLIDETFLKRLYRASPLHDIGKIGIDDAILRKPGWLTATEYEAIKRHTIIGAELLEHATRNLSFADYLPMAIKVARHHHERFDGTGYPDGLSGQDIPLSARIVSVADVFDAVTSDRVYRKALTLEQAVAIIRNGSGKLFDPAVVEAFDARLDDIKQGQSRFFAVSSAPTPHTEMFGASHGRREEEATADHRENELLSV